VGLDVSQDEVVACLLLPDGREAVRRWTEPNTQPGGEALARRPAVLVHQHQLHALRIGLEATNLYWWHLACLLKDTPLLAGVAHEIYALNPKLVAGLKGARCHCRTGRDDIATAACRDVQAGRPATRQLRPVRQARRTWHQSHNDVDRRYGSVHRPSP
jgi:hypothetical protein